MSWLFEADNEELDDGHVMHQVGGRVSATSWPIQEGNAIDVYFPRTQNAKENFEAGYYRGIVDKVGAPTATGIQKLDIDFPDEYTSTTLRLKKNNLLEPTNAPKEPDLSDGPVAVRVTEDELPETQVSATPFGLTQEQKEIIQKIFYEEGHYASWPKMWELLRVRAEAENKPAFYGIRQRQLRKFLDSQEVRQIFKIPRQPQKYRAFNMPRAPLRRVQIDTLDLGAWGGGSQGKQRYIISCIDTGSRYAYSEIIDQVPAPRPQDSTKVFLNMLKTLRQGPLKYDAAHGGNNVFNAQGQLAHTVHLLSDQGNEFSLPKSANQTYEQRMRDRLVAENLVMAPEKFIHRMNDSSQPTQSAFIEKFNFTTRQKMRMSVFANEGPISRKDAKSARIPLSYWREKLKTTVDAYNNEVAVGTNKTPNNYMEIFLLDGTEGVTVNTGTDKEKKEESERELKRQQEIKINTRVRVINRAREKAELKGLLKMQGRFSLEIYTVTKITKGTTKGGGNLSYLYHLTRASGAPLVGPKGKPLTFKREELLIVPEMESKWNSGGSKGREHIDRLRQEKIITKWDEKHNRPYRNGDTWSEREVDKIGESKWKPAGMTREKTLRRLEQYLKNGMSQDDALQRTLDSLDTEKTNTGALAIMTKDD